MDDLNLEPLEPFEVQEPEAKQVAAPVKPPRNFRRLIFPAGIVLGIFLAFGIYLLVAPEPEKLIAQVFKFDISVTPDKAKVVMSISNKQDKQAIIAKLYPLFYGKENSGIVARSIEGSTIDSTTLPLVLNPGEVRILKIKFSIQKKDLDLYADKLKDSSHIVVFKNGPPPGQLEGTLGLGWSVVDTDGKEYTNFAQFASYILTPTPKGFADSTALTHYWIISDDPFELCTNEDIVK
ncbi:MAG: hypothetical protein NTX44_03670 [Ignavibacteriales bacterium]|nr:hypothetical protein [Ignavibacteriales bacterium]